MSDRIDAIFEKLDSIDKRLFHDNGGECLQTEVNRHDDWIKTQKSMQRWLITLVAGAMILSLLNTFNNWVLKKTFEPIAPVVSIAAERLGIDPNISKLKD